MGAYWAGIDHDLLLAEWNRDLRRFDAETIELALSACADGVLIKKCGAWPPDRTEFNALCKSLKVAPEHRPALPPPGRTETQIKEGREQMAKIKAMIATTGWAK